MKTTAQVVFNSLERKTFEDMGLASFVGFPNPERTHNNKAANDDARAHTIFRRLAQHKEHWTHEQLTAALPYLDKLIEVLEREADTGYWKREARLPAGEVTPGSVALFVNPVQMIEVIVEARRQFLGDARGSRGLVLKALTLTTPLPDDLDDGDDDG